MQICTPRLAFVTGANGSGKSTFMRSDGNRTRVSWSDP
jgi:DNA mismatch repair ATPase MutS